MDNELFLRHLRNLSLEEGKAYIQEHIEELADHAAIGVLIKDESLRQRNINPFVSLKLAELLVFFSEGDILDESRCYSILADAWGCRDPLV